MNITQLEPAPARNDAFRRHRERFIPEETGCYVLTTFANEIMYMGLTTNLRRRFKQHLDSEQKTAVTDLGRAVFFWWLETEHINKVERTWINTYLQHESVLPLLNKIYSPSFT